MKDETLTAWAMERSTNSLEPLPTDLGTMWVLCGELLSEHEANVTTAKRLRDFAMVIGVVVEPFAPPIAWPELSLDLQPEKSARWQLLHLTQPLAEVTVSVEYISVGARDTHGHLAQNASDALWMLNMTTQRLFAGTLRDLCLAPSLHSFVAECGMRHKEFAASMEEMRQRWLDTNCDNN